MNIAIIGPGYVGLTAGACLSNLGHTVVCVGRDKRKIEKLKQGVMPIFEPGLEELVKRNIKEKRLFFTIDAEKAIKNSKVIFIAVGTPSQKDGSVDMSYVKKIAETIGKYIDDYKVIVDKSTVPVGTAEMVADIIKKNQKKKVDFDVVSNPEFLREGFAIKDFMVPDRIVIGANNEKSKKVMISIYKGIERTGKPIMITDIKSAEMIKYASNAFLATKISFINEISRLCEKVGADVKGVAKGIGLDTRIGPRFLQAGLGYGGSCFPKDVKAIVHTAKDNGVKLKILDMVEEVNKEQRYILIDKIKSKFKNLKNKTIAVWGLSFKPNTDDMREAPSITIINELQKAGANIKAFDPIAVETSKKKIKDFYFAESLYDAAKDADAVVLVTEWDEFRSPDFKKLKSIMKQSIIFDGRNIYEPEEVRKRGFEYIGIGRN
ncbi:UDP-glucose/GDP-mannose dehydrogenase family protein [Candidatus Woesearchaeota archaeon]|nr:UDP-glucose/GDP-mannose dehydrogenase family protein [Candidatus Woesearchaeota archaeon]